MAMHETLDTRGLKCPLPVLKARKRLKSLQIGAILELHADDPAALIDVPHFCHEAGHALLDTTESEAGGQIFVIEKR